MRALVEQLFRIQYSFKYDVTLFQRELISTLATFEKIAKAPRIFDVDDAIWFHKRGAFARSLAERCDEVICGNSFLADYFIQWNKNIHVLPTAVDTDRYYPFQRSNNSHKKIIGWSGSSSGYQTLYNIEDALDIVLKKHTDAVLSIMSDEMPRFTKLHHKSVRYTQWSPEAEVEKLQEMTVGIMPLEDSDWSRGKCSYKMLLYMACGIPVVVTPIGMNREVLSRGDIGFGAGTFDEWIDALDWLLANGSDAQRKGQDGRKVVEDHYSLAVLSPRFVQILIKHA